MGGFFRRLRRGKEAPEPEEPPADEDSIDDDPAPTEQNPENPLEYADTGAADDTYPPPEEVVPEEPTPAEPADAAEAAPTVDADGATEIAETVPVSVPEVATEPAVPVSPPIGAEPPSAGPSASAAPTAPMPVITGPPPLPPTDLDSVRAATPQRTESTRCFLCDTELVGSYCPKCHMTWNE